MRWVVVAVLVALCAVLVTLALGGDGDGTAEGPGPQRAEASAAPEQVRTRPAPEPPPVVAVASAPTRLEIPSIGVATDLVRLGVNADKTVEVPERGADAGWFEQGPVPGQNGSSVILGHVDSATGPAIFHRLETLARGDRIQVGTNNGSVEVFEVTRVATYPNEEFPARQVYAGSPDAPALNLVTCGGVYDRDRGGWQSNVVVFAAHVSTAPGR